MRHKEGLHGEGEKKHPEHQTVAFYYQQNAGFMDSQKELSHIQNGSTEFMNRFCIKFYDKSIQS